MGGWVTQPTPHGDRLENASPQRIEKNQPTQNVPHCSNPQNPNQNPIKHPSTLSPASNTSKEAVTVGTRLFLPKTRVISQRHNQAPNAPAPTWNRQLLRPNHCSPLERLLVPLLHLVSGCSHGCSMLLPGLGLGLGLRACSVVARRSRTRPPALSWRLGRVRDREV